MTRQLIVPRASAGWTTRLLAEGYCIIPDALPASRIAALDADLDAIFTRTPFCQGDFYGAQTKRFGSVLKRSPHAAALVQAPILLEIADRVLGPSCDRFQLNLTQAIEIHPGAPAQFAHRDEDMWQGPKGLHEYLINVIWPLTPFTGRNGATRLYPFSHGAAGRSAEPDHLAPILAECPPGAAICFLGSTLHGAGANIDHAPRRCLVTGYSLGWLKPYENQWLAYPPAVARHFDPELAALVGYAQHRPNLGNYEGQCPSVLLGDIVSDPLAAIDALRPDQAAMLAEHWQEQSAVARASGGQG